MNMVLYPLQSWPQGVPQDNKTYSRDPTWYRTMTMEKVRKHLQKTAIKLKDIKETYDSDLTPTRTMNPTTSQNAGTPTADATKRPKKLCLWCTGIGHNSDRCYAKDPANLQRFPNRNWTNGEAPIYFRMRFHKKFTQKEAKKMVKDYPPFGPRTGATYHQASLAWTPPPIYNADPEKELAMEANTKIGDGFPKSHNYW
jgi:hypothetical protein